jgi:two-component sensor histidine kinase
MAGLVTKSKSKSAESKEREILKVIMAYARLDFTEKADIAGTGDIFDAMGAGVNMLGEELKSSVISLREKEQLLREIHHRVKNNLQIISSLLSLQTHNVKDENFLALIRESRNRIKSMALVHEMLYATSNLSEVRLKKYIINLCESIYESYRKPNAKIEFIYNIDEGVHFDIDRMIPLGLIINEIISNSLKYAFTGNTGTISILLEQSQKRYTLTIADNGKGLPAGFAVKKHANLGMQLIFMLAEQLNGKATLLRKKGTAYKIGF